MWLARVAALLLLCVCARVRLYGSDSVLFFSRAKAGRSKGQCEGAARERPYRMLDRALRDCHVRNRLFASRCRSPLRLRCRTMKMIRPYYRPYAVVRVALRNRAYAVVPRRFTRTLFSLHSCSPVGRQCECGFIVAGEQCVRLRLVLRCTGCVCTTPHPVMLRCRPCFRCADCALSRAQPSCLQPPKLARTRTPLAFDLPR
jgi:hypothetical protein